MCNIGGIWFKVTVLEDTRSVYTNENKEYLALLRIPQIDIASVSPAEILWTSLGQNGTYFNSPYRLTALYQLLNFVSISLWWQINYEMDAIDTTRVWANLF